MKHCVLCNPDSDFFIVCNLLWMNVVYVDVPLSVFESTCALYQIFLAPIVTFCTYRIVVIDACT